MKWHDARRWRGRTSLMTKAAVPSTPCHAGSVQATGTVNSVKVGALTLQ